jgi:hypothetical protein
MGFNAEGEVTSVNLTSMAGRLTRPALRLSTSAELNLYWTEQLPRGLSKG